MNTRRKALLVLTLCALPLATMGALPLTPSTTYVANSPPPIKAQDLNDLQTYLAGLYSAVYTVKSLVVDGTGGAAASAPSGAVTISTSFGGYATSAPYATGSLAWGSQGRESGLLCGGRCALGAGAIIACGGPNIRSVVRNGTGIYTVTCNTAGPNNVRHFANVTASDPLLPVVATIETQAIVASGFVFRLHLWKLDGTDYDPDAFLFSAWGG